MSLLSWAANAEQAVANFVKSEIAKIGGDAVAVATVIESAATIADNLVNGLKNWLASPAGQLVEDIILNISGIGPYAKDVLDFLPNLIVDLGWAQAEFNKSPAQIVQDGLSYAINGAANANIKSTNLSVLQAQINTYISTLAGSPVSIQASLTQANTVHVQNASAAVPPNVQTVSPNVQATT